MNYLVDAAIASNESENVNAAIESEDQTPADKGKGKAVEVQDDFSDLDLDASTCTTDKCAEPSGRRSIGGRALRNDSDKAAAFRYIVKRWATEEQERVKKNIKSPTLMLTPYLTA